MPQRVEDDTGDSDTSEGSATGKRRDVNSYNFGAAEERYLVDFYEAHDCFLQ